MWRNTSQLVSAAIAAGLICSSVFAQPVNDLCPDAIPVGIGAIMGTTSGAVGDGQSSCGTSQSVDVYYSFTAPATCQFEVSTCDGINDVDTIISVHTACPATGANQIACNDDGGLNCFPLLSRTSFNAVAGTTYTIRVASFAKDTGAFTLIIRQLGRPANDTCAAARVISGADGTVSGDTTCAHTEGLPICTSSIGPTLFYRWTAPSSGFATFDTCGTATFDTVISVSTDCPHTERNVVRCNNDGCGRYSFAEFDCVGGASYIIRVTGANSESGTFTMRWHSSGSETGNDFCDHAHPMSLGSVRGETFGAHADAIDVCHGAPDVYYRFRSPAGTIVRLDTCTDLTYDTVLSVHSGCPASAANLIACNDDACGLGSGITFSASRNEDYIIRVSGFGSHVGNFTLTATADVDAVVFDPSTLGEYYLLRDKQFNGQFRGQSNSLGAYLTTISSFSENEFVTKSVMQADNAVRSVAIGLSDEFFEGILRWDNGEPFRFAFFGNGQPDNTNGNEDYFHIYDPIAGLWNDYPDGAYPGLFAAAESDRGILAQAINPANGHLYLLFKSSSWEGARARARAMGGDLVTINDAEENEFVRNSVANAGGTYNVWIGLNDAAADGSFVWADGSALSYANFGPGEPNNALGDEDYVELSPITGLWNDALDIQAGAPRYGVAEIVLPAVASGPIRGANGCGNYVLLGPTSFYPAYFAAQHMGGKLVTINSAAENEFIRATFAATGGGRRIWLGATDRDDEGRFTWLDANEAFTYTNFAAGEPNNTGNQDYLAMTSSTTGQWSDMSTLDPEAGNLYAVVELFCRCDWNAVDHVNSQDFFDFLRDFFNSNADFNCDGTTNSQDFFDFLQCFFVGCN